MTDRFNDSVIRTVILLLNKLAFLKKKMADWLIQWFINMGIHLFCFWNNKYFKWIIGLNDSMTHNEGSSSFHSWKNQLFFKELVDWLIQWFTHKDIYLFCSIPELTCFLRICGMDDSLTQNECSSMFLKSSKNQLFLKESVNWFND